MINKTLQPTNDMYLQFTEEELQTLNMKPGDKFDVKLHDDGSIELRPYVKLELDMEEWPREVLELIIKTSCEEDISANDVINNLLKKGLKNLGYDNDCCCNELKSEFGYTENEAVLPTAFNSEITTASSDMLYRNDAELSTTTHSTYIDPNFTNNDISITNNNV